MKQIYRIIFFITSDLFKHQQSSKIDIFLKSRSNKLDEINDAAVTKIKAFMNQDWLWVDFCDNFLVWWYELYKSFFAKFFYVISLEGDNFVSLVQVVLFNFIMHYAYHFWSKIQKTENSYSFRFTKMHMMGKSTTASFLFWAKSFIIKEGHSFKTFLKPFENK